MVQAGVEEGESEAVEGADEVENDAAADEDEAAAVGCREVCAVSRCFLFVCENSRTAVVGERRRLAAA